MHSQENVIPAMLRINGSVLCFTDKKIKAQNRLITSSGSRLVCLVLHAVTSAAPCES